MTTKQILKALSWAARQAREWRGAQTHNPELLAEYDEHLKELDRAMYHTTIRLSGMTPGTIPVRKKLQRCK